MAKVKIQGNASGTGVLTVTAPNTSTDRTITLPDEDVTLGAATPSIDDNGNATAITIDSDENVLIGKTTYVGGSGVTGVDIRPAGMVNIAREGDTLMYMNRKTSDGSIVEFRKDGTTVGTISSRSGNGVVLNSQAYAGALALAGTNEYYWDSVAFNPVTDNTNDLGKSGNRFKDLYLSGGLKVGGTDAAHTLDDYEEGTFTPTVLINGSTTGTTQDSGNQGVYTKIGNTVICDFTVGINSKGSVVGGVTIGGLPFTIANNLTSTSIDGGSISWGYMSGTTNSNDSNGINRIYGAGWGGSSYAVLFKRPANEYYGHTDNLLTDVGLQNSFNCRGSISFKV